MIYKVLRRFANNLTADNKYSLLNRDNVTQSILMQLSLKQFVCSNSFLHFSNVDKILKICQKKMTLMADVFAKLWTPENVVRLISKKSCIRGSFDKQHGKCDQILLKSERQNL